MKIYSYKSYDDYVRAQTQANKQKIERVWAKDYVLRQLLDYVKSPKTILCHGSRNGGEMKILKKLYPDSEILGTDISETANQFENTIQHDFQEPKEEWVNKWDILYSNSFDHCFDPTKCLTTWKNQLSKSGLMFVELMLGNDNRSSRSDPLEIEEKEFRDLAKNVGLEVVSKIPGIYWANFTILGSEVYVLKRIEG